MLVYHSKDLILIGYTDSDFQSDLDFSKSTSSYVFTLGGRAISWKSVKKSCIANSTMEAEYVVACEAAKEVVRLKKFHYDLGAMRTEQNPVILFYDNSGAVAQFKDPRNHKKGKHIERKYQIIQDIVAQGDVVVAKIDSANNLSNDL